MIDTVTLRGITFTVQSWGDLHKLTCSHCHPGVDFKKGDIVEVEGLKYLVYLVEERSINLQRTYPPDHFKPKHTVTLLATPDGETTAGDS